MITSLLVGFLVARRVARPIYELQLQVASAAQRIRIEVPPGRAGFEALGEHMSAILRKIEETDAAIAEQRRRLIQSEKMSAIGEVAAKLAHEILNPLTGIKAAVARGAGVQLGGIAAVSRAFISVRINSITCAPIFVSSAEVGSSNSTSFGLLNRARPMATR